jgi:hypothetical protein
MRKAGTLYYIDKAEIPQFLDFLVSRDIKPVPIAGPNDSTMYSLKDAGDQRLSSITEISDTLYELVVPHDNVLEKLMHQYLKN